MSEEGATNISEMLSDMDRLFDNLFEQFSQRSRSVKDALEIFLQAINDEQTLHNLLGNNSARTNLKNHIHKLLDMNHSLDPVFLKNLHLLQEKCVILSKMIVQEKRKL